MLAGNRHLIIATLLFIVSSANAEPELDGSMFNSVESQQQGPLETKDNAPLEAKEEEEPVVKKDPVAVAPPKGLIPEDLVSMGAGDYFSRYAFVVDKSQRTLTIWEKQNGKVHLVEYHPIDFGKKQGDKKFLGDLRTPEGIYFFQQTYKAPYLNFDNYGSRAFTMDYPNYYDKREKKTGSGIWLHAVPDSKSLFRGSRGCVVVRDEVVQTLDRFINLGTTPIIVQDEVNYVKEDLYKEGRAKILAWLEAWKQSWESKDLDSYLSYYHSDFKALKMNKEQWRKYKESLNQKYNFIKVNLQRPSVYKHDDEYVIRFLQSYQSDQVTDFGEKTLYLKIGENGQPQIYGEIWKEIKSELLASKFDVNKQGNL